MIVKMANTFALQMIIRFFPLFVNSCFSVIRLKRLQHPEIGFFTKPKVTECSRKSSDASLNQLSGGKSGETGIALSGAWSTPQMSKESSTNDGNSQANQQDDTPVQQPQVTINESPQSSSPQPSDENEVENGTGGSENLSGQSSSKDFLGTPPSHQNSDVVYNQEGTILRLQFLK